MEKELTLEELEQDSAKYALGLIVHAELSNLKEKYGDRNIRVTILIDNDRKLKIAPSFIDLPKDVDEQINLLISLGYTDEEIVNIMKSN